jgi:hypothetical protein
MKILNGAALFRPRYAEHLGTAARILSAIPQDAHFADSDQRAAKHESHGSRGFFT